MSTKQELMTPELAASIREYEIELSKWGSEQAAQGRGVVYAILAAAPLWAVSYFCAAERFSQTSNEQSWFTALTVVSFGAAFALTAAAIIVGIVRITTQKPIQRFRISKNVTFED